VPQAEVIHHEGQSTRQVQEESFVNLWRSRRRLYDKHYGPIKNWLAKRLVRTGMKLRVRMTKRKAKQGELDKAEAATQIRAYTSASACFD
jgi:GT2 family glycosyltransferase